MHSEGRPSNYFFQLFHTLSGRADKKGRRIYPFFTRINGIYLFKLEQCHSHTCFGHSNIIFILYAIYTVSGHNYFIKVRFPIDVSAFFSVQEN